MEYFLCHVKTSFGVKLAYCQTGTEGFFLSGKDSQQPKDKLTIYLFDANIVNVTFNFADKALLYSTLN
jgi:hypothetical protein